MKTKKRTSAFLQQPTARTRRYPSDLTDAQWQRIRLFIPQRTFGRNPQHHPRIILNAIFYLTQVGCPWHYLPADFPPYTTVSYYYRR